MGIKYFEIFYAEGPKDFRERMIQYWMKLENVSRETALEFYAGDRFDLLCERLTLKTRRFLPDLGYSDDKNGTLCFEEIDNNFVIPVNILKKRRAIKK